MVWFQCESCGDDLKKPKLPNHFRTCHSNKFSCIDCGVTFDRLTVQSHTQCITEAEKYGPKGQGNAANGSAAKPKQEKPKLDVDINIGLSNRYPWFCSLCNTKATSQQALLLHGDGKKHRGKVRAHIAKQQPSAETVQTGKDSNENKANTIASEDKNNADKKENIPSNGVMGKNNSLVEDEHLSAKKRKIDSDKDKDGSTNKGLNGLDNGNATQSDIQDTPTKLKKAKYESELKGAKSKKTNCEVGKEVERNEAGDTKESSKEKVKWKKLITSVLKTAPDEALKMKKLRKLVYKNLQDSGIAVDDSDFNSTLEHKVNSSSKFEVDGKYVRLAA